MYDLSNILEYQCLFLADIKYEYQAVIIHPNDNHYLAFYISWIGEVQLTRIPQRARTLSFMFIRLINFTPKYILSLQREFSLLNSKISKDFVSLAFYINEIFRAFKFY